MSNSTIGNAAANLGGTSQAAATVVAPAQPAAAAAAATTPAVPTPPAASPAPTMSADELAKQIKAAADQAAAGERARLKALQDLAPDHPAFALEQFNAGADVGTAAGAYVKLLAGALKAAKTQAAASPQSSEGVPPVATVPAEKREAQVKGMFGVIRIAGAATPTV